MTNTIYSVASRLINEMSVKLPSLSANEGVARAICASFCAQLDPTATEIADVKCAVSEAVTNSIVHGYKNSEKHMVFLNCKIEDIIIYIHD